MRTYAMHQARAELAALVDRALAGEPQRITRHGRDAVILVAEADWVAQHAGAPSLGHLIAAHAQAGTFGDDATNRPWVERPLGADVA